MTLPFSLSWVTTFLARLEGMAKPMADAAARGGEDVAVDADDLALHVDQRAAGVTPVDGGVGLEEVLVGRHVGADAQLAALGADDTGRDRVFHAQGIADGQDPFAHPDLAGIAQFDYG